MSTIESKETPQVSIVGNDADSAPASGQANGATPTPIPSSTLEGFDRWIKDFQKYESILVRVFLYLFPLFFTKRVY